MQSSEPAETFLVPDDERFRAVLGHFATGVTIITALDDGEPVGMAANSFTSLSLDPPLILFCVAHSSSTWPRIERAGTFAVNILGEDHEELSQLFARRGVDRFAEHAVAYRRLRRAGAARTRSRTSTADSRPSTRGATTRSSSAGCSISTCAKVPGPLLFFRGGYERMHDS